MIRRQHAILFLIGVALSIAQFLMIRDFVTILYGEEVVIVLVTSSFFVGLSAGYLLSLRIPAPVFRWLFVVSLLLHLTFPFSYRYLAAALGSVGAGGYSYLTLLFGYALLFNSVFASFLPRLVSEPDDAAGSEATRLRNYYGCELAGFMVGIGVVVFSWNEPAHRLMVPYWALLGVLLHLVLRVAPLTVGYAGLALLASIFVDDLDRHSNETLYEYKQGVEGARMLYSVNSPYQRVDVVEDENGERYLFLDGLMNLNASDLEALNYYIATIPARLIQPKHALLIGNGTLSSVPRLYPLVERLTSVELDGGVLEAGRRFFTPPEKLEGLERWRLVVDDGKHFLRTTDDRFDLVVVDVPSPLTIQEGYLHTMEFYALVRDRLSERGVIAVQISGRLQRNNRTPARITAALRAIFPEVLVIFSEEADRGFAYASADLPFGGDDVRIAARAFEPRVAMIRPEGIDAFLVEADPMSLNHMDLVLRRGWERFRERYFHD